MRGPARNRRRGHSVPGGGRPGRPRTGVGVLRAGFAVGGDGRPPAGERTDVRRGHRSHRAAHPAGVRIFGDRSHVGAGDRDRNRRRPADDLRHAGGPGRSHGRAGGTARCGDRTLDGRGGGGRGHRSALAGGRRPGDLPALEAHGPAVGNRGDGVGGIARENRARRVVRPRRRRRRGRRRRLAADHGDRR